MSGGKPGRPSKGPRTAQTIRFPNDLHQAMKQRAVELGYDNFQDYVVDFLVAAHDRSVKVPGPRRKQDPLPLAG
ncbi:hypothetical protein [Planomonospora venezuelensis]|uniref:Uncharacterized protein n=1 Tax=Planomonospora venezuelensis TaxID=1999 RepID=A0A841DH93_PLAVE|nr:hypothetical protein [Planomonospora venezuelensis]MBB5967754.1 hypothetical protein [Planomonospora venezuelensis]GIN02650.1 hypothetical protein Pve01_43080 [Planomonospora venezuelensis]